MEKLDSMSLNNEKDNISKLKELFPSVVADGKIDFELLKTILGDEVDVGREKYQFTWPGKVESIKIAQLPSTSTLRPSKEKSRDWDTTENLYIEGDNLEVLKQLQKTYYGKIKIIYIDPPYNTGHDFVYEDNFKNSINNYVEQTSQTSKSNPETSGRYHTAWLNMMYPRLILARNLLQSDGAIYVSIDDNESSNLRKILDEIFGANNFVADICCQRTYAPRNDSKGISCEAEHLYVYRKSSSWQPKKLPRTAAMNEKYKNPDGDDRLWRPDNPCGPGASSHQGMVYAIQHPFTGQMLYPSNGAHWRYQQRDMLEIMRGWGNYDLEDIHDEEKRAEICGVSYDSVRAGVKAIVLKESLENSKRTAEKVLENGKLPLYYFTSGGKGGIAKKTYLNEDNGKVVTNLWLSQDIGHTDEAKKELLNLFDGISPFDTPKPNRLIDRILNISTDKEGVVLDFFSGSGTTAQSVMNVNANNNKQLKFIMVQLPETSMSSSYDTLCDIGEERIRRAGEKIRKEWEEKNRSDGLFAEEKEFPVDIGFKVFKLDSTNIRPWDNENELNEESLFTLDNVFKEGRTKEDVLYEIMLKYGIFDQPVTAIDINGKTMYRIGRRHMIVCLEDDVTEQDINAIGELSPRVVVFKEAGFKDDNQKINAEYNLKKAGVEDVKCV